MRGISVHLTEGNEQHAEQAVKSLLPERDRDAGRSPATGNPGEVKIDVTVPTVAGETNSRNNHYTYHVAFQA